jgi:hypothetical protein
MMRFIFLAVALVLFDVGVLRENDFAFEAVDDLPDFRTGEGFPLDSFLAVALVLFDVGVLRENDFAFEAVDDLPDFRTGEGFPLDGFFFCGFGFRWDIQKPSHK